MKVSLPSSASCLPVRVVPLSSRAEVQVAWGQFRRSAVAAPRAWLSQSACWPPERIRLASSCVRDLREDFAESDGVETNVGFDVDGAVDAHGEGGAQGVLHAGGADGDGDDLGFDAALAKAESFFDAVLVHGVHDELAVFESDGAVGDVYALFGIEDLAEVGQYPHVFTLSSVAFWFDSGKLSGVVALE